MHILSKIIFPAVAMALMACGGSGTASGGNTEVPAEGSGSAKVEFDADSAFAYVAAQTAFGPRVPNTEAHRRCAAWLASTLHDLGASDVTVDTARLMAYDGTALTAYNITASLNPGAQRRVLLLSHWDSRPWADHDPDPANRRKPIDGANDGASGVGVILEVARALGQAGSGAGVDILFVDAEDYGRHNDDSGAAADSDSWAMGSAYWVENPTLDLSRIRYAILLDMVGGKDARFPREYYSEYAAREVNDKVWAAAASAGYADRFVNDVGAAIVDDHISLIKAGLPAIDIIETANPATGSFNPTWHTLDDNIDNIDKSTLKAVGQTIITAITGN